MKAAEKLRQSQLPRKPSLVNESLIAEVFGLQLPAQKGKGEDTRGRIMKRAWNIRSLIPTRNSCFKEFHQSVNEIL